MAFIFFGLGALGFETGRWSEVLMGGRTSTFGAEPSDMLVNIKSNRLAGLPFLSRCVGWEHSWTKSKLPILSFKAGPLDLSFWSFFTFFTIFFFFFFFFFFFTQVQTPVTLCSGEWWSILVVRLAHSADLRSRLRHVSSAPSVAYSTGCSRVDTHPGTNPARRCLTSVI